MGPLRWRALLALALLLPAAPALSLPPLGAPLGESYVVVAVIDTGINPYHAEFRDEARTAPPSDYLSGYPIDALPLGLCLDSAANPDCASMPGAVAHDAAVWSDVKGAAGPDGGLGPLYHIPGTRIVGAISLGARGDGFTGATRILDDSGHGTATASVAAGRTLGQCPSCLLVVVEGPGDAALAWARDQPWIDVVSNSWGLEANIGWPFAPVPSDITRGMALQGKTVVFSAGNGLGLGIAPGITDIPDYLLPGETTYTSPYAGPDWVVTVGATEPGNGQPVAASAKPVDVSAAGVDVVAAGHRSRTGTLRDFSGTSASAPIVAGAFGEALLEARRALGDARVGPRADEVVAEGPAPAGALPGSAVSDGRVTREELRGAVFATARPCPLAFADCPQARYTWPTPLRIWGWSVPAPPVLYPLIEGYGTVDGATREDAVQVLLGHAPMPPRPEADLWARSDSLIRQRLWGSWPHGAEPGDLLT